jgi:flagellar motor protein MotB
MDNTNLRVQLEIFSQPSFWPAALDLVTSTLMIFLLITYLQATLNTEDLKLLTIRKAQQHFRSSFNTEFREEQSHRAVVIQAHLNSLQITFSNRVLFDIGEHRLHEEGKKLLSRCVKVFNRASETGYSQIQVEGHTDANPYCSEKETAERPCRPDVYPSDNWELSSARAISVVKFLVDRGVNPDILSATGYAFYRPVSRNDEARNRRIELRIFFSSANKSLPTPGG